jgi:hypothetical protein
MTPSHTTSFLEQYDFSAALSLSPAERYKNCVERVEEQYRLDGLGWWEDIPMVPPSGASQEELKNLESALSIPLPTEYFQFLSRWCYLNIELSGMEIWGTSYKGNSIGRPWVSSEHRTPYKYLVFGSFWKYADGDQLMFDLNDATAPVVIHLHEHHLIEYFAPSFSLALWRMVYEESFD